jgi:hypothetical protein
MTARTRVEALAAAVSASGVTCYPEPGAAGRGDLFAFVDAPSFTYEPAARAFCPNGRPPRLRASVVLVGAGTAPGQLLALLDAAADLVALLDGLPGWMPNGDGTPATYADTLPAYTFPLTTT